MTTLLYKVTICSEVIIGVVWVFMAGNYMIPPDMHHHAPIKHSRLMGVFYEPDPWDFENPRDLSQQG
ncbi:MAG: hypothetical protein IID46_13525 [Planctomycetes bacterium]|nr:hypothetical protein [Planctomycetota bacterium]